MAERVLLHIGAPKTGTTYLQTTMWHNRDRLQEAGFLYPGRRRMDHHNATLVPCGRDDDPRAGAWERLTGEIRDFTGTGILTHEFYSAASAEGAAAALRHLAPAEVVLVLTVRDYPSQLPAYWQQSVKMGDDRTFGAYTKEMLDGLEEKAWSWLTMDIEAVLRRWTATLRPDQVYVVTVPPRDAPSDLLWRRFASVVGLSALDLDTDVARPNESVGVVQAELARRLWPRLDPEVQPNREMHRWFRLEFAQRVLVPQGGSRFGVRRSEAEQLVQKSSDAAAFIESAGFHVVGDLADLVPSDIPELPHPDDVTEAELLACARQTIAQMVDRIEVVETDLRQLRGLPDDTDAPVRRHVSPADSASLDPALDAVARLVSLQRRKVLDLERLRREAAAREGSPDRHSRLRRLRRPAGVARRLVARAIRPLRR